MVMSSPPEPTDDRAHLRAEMFAESQAFDRTLTTLAAGSLVLSVTFVGNLTCGQPTSGWLIVTSWGLMGAALVAVVVSQRTSVIVQTRYYEHGDTPAESDDKRSMFFRRLTNLLNWIALIAFLVGMAALIIFASINLT